MSLYLSSSIVLSQLDIVALEHFIIVEATQNMVSYINRRLSALGWYKYGTINDGTLVKNSNDTSSNNNSNAGNQVNACEINYRVVQLLPTKQKF